MSMGLVCRSAEYEAVSVTLRPAALALMLAFAISTAACDAPADTREASGPAQAAASAPAASADDRAVLEALYHATDGPNWTNNRNWLSDAPIGAWHGVTTDRSGRVTVLWLTGNQLRGEIPPDLGRLSHLTHLWLEENQLTGAIPPELGRLTHLAMLDLSKNQLSGTIPPALGQLTTLTRLQLNENQLSGPIPLELGHLSHLGIL